jgi:hypothetical protein
MAQELLSEEQVSNTLPESVIHALETQAEKPPSGDVHISNFNRGLVLAVQQNPNIAQKLNFAVQLREQEGRHLSDTHLINLALRAVNHEVLWSMGLAGHSMFQRQHHMPYPEILGLNDANDWASLIQKIHERYGEGWYSSIKDRETQTNVPRRGIPIPFIVNRIHNGHPVRIIDGGCSGNGMLGRLAISPEQPFSPLEDHTPELPLSNGTVIPAGQISKMMNKPVNLQYGLGVDLGQPDRQWLASCRYPREAKPEQVWLFMQDLERYSNLPNVHFQTGSILNLSEITQPADLVVLSTVLYQLTPEEREQAIQEALQVPEVKWVYVQEFAVDNNRGGLEYLTDWGPDTYRGFMFSNYYNGPRELIIMDGGRVRTVKPGKDYQEFWEMTTNGGEEPVFVDD